MLFANIHHIGLWLYHCSEREFNYSISMRYVTKQYNLVPASPLGRKQAHRAIHWPRIRGLAV